MRRYRNTVKGITNDAIRFDSPLTIATQEPIELTPELIEIIKNNCKTSYEDMIQKHGGELVNPKMGGTTIDPVEEFCKLSEEKKAEFVEGIIKIIERNEAEKRGKNKG